MSMWSSQCLLSLSWSSCCTGVLGSHYLVLVLTITFACSSCYSFCFQNCWEHYFASPLSKLNLRMMSLDSCRDTSCKQMLQGLAAVVSNTTESEYPPSELSVWTICGWVVACAGLRTRIACRGLQPVGAKCYIFDYLEGNKVFELLCFLEHWMSPFHCSDHFRVFYCTTHIVKHIQ